MGEFFLPSFFFFPLYESAEDKGAVELVSANVYILTNRLRLHENYFFVKIQPLMYHAWIFLFEEKAMFYSQDIQLLMLLINSKSSQTSKPVTSSQSLCVLENTLSIIPLESQVMSNEIWSDSRATYGKYFQLVFSSINESKHQFLVLSQFW